MSTMAIAQASAIFTEMKQMFDARGQQIENRGFYEDSVMASSKCFAIAYEPSTPDAAKIAAFNFEHAIASMETTAADDQTPIPISLHVIRESGHDEGRFVATMCVY